MDIYLNILTAEFLIVTYISANDSLKNFDIVIGFILLGLFLFRTVSDYRIGWKKRK
jgi:hypothetical protein